VSTCIAKGS